MLQASQAQPTFATAIPVVCADSAIKEMARCLFNFDKADLNAVCKHLKSQKKEWETLSDEALVDMLPLSTWKRLVRREYLPGAVQAERINAWRQQYIIDEGVFVDTSTAGRVRTLVRGGVEGLAEFEKQLISQVELMNKDMLSGERLAAGWQAAVNLIEGLLELWQTGCCAAAAAVFKQAWCSSVALAGNTPCDSHSVHAVYVPCRPSW